MLTAEQLHARGLEAIVAGRSRRARGLLERAAEEASGPLLARVRASLAYVLADLGDSGQALALCESVLAGDEIDDETRGLVEAQRAGLLTWTGRSTEALAGFDRAMSLLGEERLADRGKAHLNRGGVHLQHNDPAAAEGDFLAAADLLTRADLPIEAAMAEHNLGYARLLRGDLVLALASMDRAREVLAPLSPVHEATCDQDRAEVLVAAGQLREGRAALERAAAAYGARRLRRRQAEAELTLSRQLVGSDPAEAERWGRRAARRFRSGGHDTWADRAEAVALTAAVARGDSSAALLTRADRLARALRAEGMEWAARSVDLASARAAIGRGNLVEASARVGRQRLPHAAPLDVQLTERGVRAELAASAGRRTDALRHLRLGLADLTEWQSSFGSLDLQTNVIGQGASLAATGLSLAVGSRVDRVVFEWSERARMLSARIQPVRAPADSELTTSLAQLRESPPPARAAELRRWIRERAWQKEGSGRVTEPCTVEELQAGLGDRALVSHVVAGERVVALVVTPDGVARVDLGSTTALRSQLGGLLPDLDTAAAAMPDTIGGVVRRELVARLDRLCRLLVGPLRPVIGDRALVLTPSGLLAGVPWTLLPDLVGRPLTVAQSATSWLAGRATPLKTARAGFVAGPRVARAEAEIAATAKEWTSARTLVGSAATAAAASALASEVDVLHVAAHGRHSAQSPLFSGVGLADGPWFGYDVDQLPVVPDIVLLSACEVGRSTVRWGEELIGMTAAWLHAGARCVIASPASVADEAAYDALVGVHRGLSAGQAPDVALAAAVPAPSSDRPPAPFVCFS